MNLIKKNFTSYKGDHYSHHQSFGVPYTYLLRHSKRITRKILNAISIIIKCNSASWCLYFKSVGRSLWKDSFSEDCILMIDEMYVRKAAA